MAADKQTIDVLMTFIDGSGNGVPAEGSSDWDASDDLMDNFEPGTYFEVEDWGIATEIHSSEEKAGGRAQGAPGFTNSIADHKLQNHPGRGGQPNLTAQNTTRKSSDEFSGYLETGQAGHALYPAKVDLVTIVKQVEWASITFLQNCMDATPFEKAVLVKRKFTGGKPDEKLKRYAAFIRIEFKQPLITKVEWDEGDVMKEKVTFICRGIKVAYKQQSDAGTIYKGANTMEWDYDEKLASG